VLLADAFAQQVMLAIASADLHEQSDRRPRRGSARADECFTARSCSTTCCARSSAWAPICSARIWARSCYGTRTSQPSSSRS
jgi:hypothetical protein